MAASASTSHTSLQDMLQIARNHPGNGISAPNPQHPIVVSSSQPTPTSLPQSQSSSQSSFGSSSSLFPKDSAWRLLPSTTNHPLLQRIVRIEAGCRNVKAAHEPHHVGEITEVYRTWKYSVQLLIHLSSSASSSSTPSPSPSSLHHAIPTLAAELSIVDADTLCLKDSPFEGPVDTSIAMQPLATTTPLMPQTATLRALFPKLMFSFISERLGTAGHERRTYAYRIVVKDGQGQPILDILSPGFCIWGRARRHFYKTVRAAKEGEWIQRPKVKREDRSEDDSSDDDDDSNNGAPASNRKDKHGHKGHGHNDSASVGGASSTSGALGPASTEEEQFEDVWIESMVPSLVGMMVNVAPPRRQKVLDRLGKRVLHVIATNGSGLTGVGSAGGLGIPLGPMNSAPGVSGSLSNSMMMGMPMVPTQSLRFRPSELLVPTPVSSVEAPSMPPTAMPPAPFSSTANSAFARTNSNYYFASPSPGVGHLRPTFSADLGAMSSMPSVPLANGDSHTNVAAPEAKMARLN